MLLLLIVLLLREGQGFGLNARTFVGFAPRTTRLLAGTSLSHLEEMRLTELKALAKTLDIRPGVLRKAELVQLCHERLLQKWDNKADPAPSPTEAEDSEAQSKQEQTNVPRYQRRVGNLRPMPLEEQRHGRAIGSSDPSLEHSSAEKFKFPYGSIRDNRLSCEPETADMDLTFLGTASCIPSISRGVSSIAFRYHSDMWLFDCGESTQLQLQKSRVKASKIKKIFITHLHGDHSFGLPGVLCMIGQATQEEREAASSSGEGGNSNRGSEPIEIYGPEGIRDMVRATIQLTYSRVVAPFRVHELKGVPYLHGKCVKWRPPDAVVRTRPDAAYGEQPGGRDILPDANGHYMLLTDGDLTVQAAPMQHTVPCVGFVVNEAPRQGRLRVELVQPLVERQREQLKKQLGLRDPNKVFAILKAQAPGDSFTFPDGTVLRTEEFLEPAKKGRKVVIMGDTCTGDHIAALSEGADVLIHEATNAFLPEIDKTRHPDYSRLERDTFVHGHSTPQMAGRFAQRIAAKRLVLTHFSPRYRGEDDERSMRIMWRIEDQARANAPLLDGQNDVIAAWDMMFLPIGLKEPDDPSPSPPPSAAS
jgi:ribonuclease Z